MSHDKDKFHILGSLIRKINTPDFHTSSLGSSRTWANFKQSLLDFALPPLWRTELRYAILKIRMGKNKFFPAYSLHARTLQSLVNFNDHSISLGTFNWQSL
jgi:hypothetical protein